MGKDLFHWVRDLVLEDYVRVTRFQVVDLESEVGQRELRMGLRGNYLFDWGLCLFH